MTCDERLFHRRAAITVDREDSEVYLRTLAVTGYISTQTIAVRDLKWVCMTILHSIKLVQVHVSIYMSTQTIAVRDLMNQSNLNCGACLTADRSSS